MTTQDDLTAEFWRAMLPQHRWTQNLPDSPEVQERNRETLTWQCEYCGAEVPPLELVLHDIPRFLRRQWCNCERAQQERLIAQLDERDRQAGALVINAGLQAGKLAGFTFERWQTERNPPWAAQALEAVTGYVEGVADDGANWLYLHGPYGVGKTHLATAALRRIAFERFWTPMLVVWPAHCSAVQESWNDDETGPSERQLWGQMRRADVLLLDDVDKRDPTAWALGRLYEVMDYRQLRQKPTLITANRSIKELQRSWSRPRRKKDAEIIRDMSAAILSRIVGQLCATVEIRGTDQRWV